MFMYHVIYKFLCYFDMGFISSVFEECTQLKCNDNVGKIGILLYHINDSYKYIDSYVYSTSLLIWMLLQNEKHILGRK